jgi:hypothetical protein
MGTPEQVSKRLTPNQLKTKGNKMAKSLSVKIPTQLLIDEIEKNIVSIEAEIATYDERVAQYERDSQKFEETLLKWGLDYVLANHEQTVFDGIRNNNLSASIDHCGNVSIYVKVDKGYLVNKPERPSNPNERSYYGREYVSKLDLLKRNLKVLKMTTQDTVSASTYNSVMELL